MKATQELSTWPSNALPVQLPIAPAAGSLVWRLGALMGGDESQLNLFTAKVLEWTYEQD